MGSPSPKRARIGEADGGQTRHEVDQALESLRKRNEELFKVKEEKKDDDPSPLSAPPEAGEMEEVLEESVEPEPPRDDGSWWSWSDSDWSWWNSNRGSRWGDDQWRGHREEWRGHREFGRGRGGGGGGGGIVGRAVDDITVEDQKAMVDTLVMGASLTAGATNNRFSISFH